MHGPCQTSVSLSAILVARIVGSMACQCAQPTIMISMQPANAPEIKSKTLMNNAAFQTANVSFSHPHTTCFAPHAVSTPRAYHSFLLLYRLYKCFNIMALCLDRVEQFETVSHPSRPFVRHPPSLSIDLLYTRIDAISTASCTLLKIV